MNKDMIYHIFREAPKSRNVEIIKFLKEYKLFWATCLFSGHAMSGDGGGAAPPGTPPGPPRSSKLLNLHRFYKHFRLAVINVLQRCLRRRAFSMHRRKARANSTFQRCTQSLWSTSAAISKPWKRHWFYNQKLHWVGFGVAGCLFKVSSLIYGGPR